MYDFSCCKLCKKTTAHPTFKLKTGVIYRCSHCDFHFLDRLDEIPSIEAHSNGLTATAWDYIEARVDESASLLPYRLALVKEFVALPEARCLDLGAGVGQFLHLLEKARADGSGIEPSNVRREYAERKFGISLRKELVDQDYWQSGFNRYFDVICLWDVIEHLNFPLETLQNACQLLKPGGYLFLDTPSRHTASYSLSEKLYCLSGGKLPLFLDNFYSAAPYGHKQIFTTKQLQQLTKKLGLDVCTLRDSYRPSVLRGDKIILASRKPTDN